MEGKKSDFQEACEGIDQSWKSQQSNRHFLKNAYKTTGSSSIK